MKHTNIHPIDTLMLIDDSTFDQMVYQRITVKSGLVGELVQYLDATEALTHLADKKNTMPDVILLDINMPQMNGFEFLEAATKSFGVEFCPIVVMLSTSLNPIDEERARGFDVVQDFFNKPLTHDQLHTLCHLISETASQSVQPLT